MAKERRCGRKSRPETHGICGATPLEGQTQADHPGEEGKETESIKPLQLVFERHLCVGTVGNLKQKENEHHNHSSQRKVDIEAPSPGDTASESAADQRASN